MKTLNIIAISLIFSILFYSCDKNEFAPVVADQDFSITENSPSNTVIGVVDASDADEGQVINFEIIDGNEEYSFLIDSESGILSVGNPTLLDYESTTEFLLKIAVSDNHEKEPLESTATIQINLLDENEFKPVVTPQVFELGENSAQGFEIGTIVASDEESHQKLQYTIIVGDDSGYFHLDPASGILTVLDSSAFDFELNQQLSIEVEVSDGHENPKKAQATITVNINNVPEITDDLIAYYPFNGDANDESGNNNDGLLIGTSFTSDKLGNPDKAIVFDGIDDYISLPEDFDFMERTISFWFNAENIPEWNQNDSDNSMGIIYTSDHPNTENGLTKMWVTKVDGVPKLCFHNGGADVILDNSFAINEKEWYFAAVTISSTSIKYYINGELLKSRDFPGNIHSTWDTGAYNATMGVGRLLTHRFYNGKLDEVRVYNAELTSSDISNMYDVGVK